MAPKHLEFNDSWIWHPDWKEEPTSPSAGGFVHFRKEFSIIEVPQDPRPLRISADTRYKLYINSSFVHAGPVKGDQQIWFYDELDIQPYLRIGTNHIAIRVLRFYYATSFATSFPRSPLGGLMVDHVQSGHSQGDEIDVRTNHTWEAALDLATRLPRNMKDDDFLHVYEDVDQRVAQRLTWVSAEPYRFLTSFGLASPWRLSPRLIPLSRFEPTSVNSINNVRSDNSLELWAKVLQNPLDELGSRIVLPAGTKHHVELGFESHVTAFIQFRFTRPTTPGSTLRVTYSECYEDPPKTLPYFRVKDDRCDATKSLIGPQDRYIFGGTSAGGAPETMHYYETDYQEEIFAPFHFRTFRFIALDIDVVEDSDLIMLGVEVVKTNYPLQVTAGFNVACNRQDTNWAHQLWTISLRTLVNCMHDCYEDCPFYEQLQYAMDTRSSSLFTYCASGDDRLARQAILQIHNSYQPAVGLTASRAPSHQLQVIPNFSLFWIGMLTDHYEYFGDAKFVGAFLPTAHVILETFHRRIDDRLGLVQCFEPSQYWEFVDWTEAWKPFGIPPAAKRTGFQTFTNALYAYILRRLVILLTETLHHGLAGVYEKRANAIIAAIQTHCFDGEYFTDGLATDAPAEDYSVHNQIWAILCGAVTGKEAQSLLEQSLASHSLTRPSTAMSFYTLRALSLVGGNTYNAHFHNFWEPWRKQVAQNVTTWVEDDVSQRSDCHAWGSSPIFEFLTEVAGVKPAGGQRAGGWAVISFKPRVELFPELDAKVPFWGDYGSGIARVRWSREKGEANVVKISLSLEPKLAEAQSDGKVMEESIAKIPVHVNLPDGRSEMIDGLGVVEFRVVL